MNSRLKKHVYEKCSVCFGVGIIPEMGWDLDGKTCSACNGSGKVLKAWVMPVVYLIAACVIVLILYAFGVVSLAAASAGPSNGFPIIHPWFW